jgi:cystathionine gamma-synthase
MRETPANLPFMPGFAPIPLGQPISPSPHAVSCSLPTLRAVRGYEEKDPEILASMTSGYPRFVVHPFVRQLAEHLSAEAQLTGRRLWLTSSPATSAALVRHLSRFSGRESGAKLEPIPFSEGGVSGAAHADTAELSARAKLFLQNVGGFMSSREAEDQLVRRGLRREAHREELFAGDSAEEVRGHLRRALPGAGDGDIFLANSGINAVYSAFKSAAELQARRGRTIWVQLGWLYLDTIAILKRFTATPADYVYLRDVFDLTGLERLFAEKGARVAGLITEIPTNPLIQTPDVDALATLCRRHGAILILDPSVASLFSVNLFPKADMIVNSLTKFTGNEGDVLAGALAINPSSPDAADLRRRVAAQIEPIYPRDLARLAAQIGQTEDVLSRIASATPQVASFLAGHPKVKDVFWALSPASRANYLRIAWNPEAVGGMISFTLRGALAPFYDRVRLPKGPSFGMKKTLISPFMFLAHYDLVNTPDGRAELAESGLDPDLLRMCVGTEPVADILSALDEALG